MQQCVLVTLNTITRDFSYAIASIHVLILVILLTIYFAKDKERL
jgi:hypothetical protein